MRFQRTVTCSNVTTVPSSTQEVKPIECYCLTVLRSNVTARLHAWPFPLVQGYCRNPEPFLRLLACMTGTVGRVKTSDLEEILQTSLWVCQIFLIIRPRLCIFGRNVPAVRLCPSQDDRVHVGVGAGAGEGCGHRRPLGGLLNLVTRPRVPSGFLCCKVTILVLVG